ncbi:toxin-activating lysine-acyltransferase [Pelagibacterium halotolerans]|uniref:toxin-activating lysine-acyltransferase n=1 Tax=Pelagibacterium halotolerans TaxID=531813 RepID=UPI00384A4D74
MTFMRQTLLSHEGLLHRMPAAKLAQLQGEALDLFRASERHRDATISEFSVSILPAIHFDQFRIYRDAKRPVGWVSWAFMTADEGRGYMAGNFDFQISTWIGGDYLWFIDFIAPYGHAAKIAEDLRSNVFPDKIGFAPDLDAANGSKRVRKFYGARVKGAGGAVNDLDFLASDDT